MVSYIKSKKKKNKLIEIESRLVIARIGLGRVKVVKGYKLPVTR